jgi:hypothetical protein
MLCLVLSASVGLAACTGPRARPAMPTGVSDSDQAACAEFVHQRTEQLRRAATPARGGQWTVNDVAWGVAAIVAAPFLVTAFMAALPFGSWKALRDPSPDPGQLERERAG